MADEAPGRAEGAGQGTGRSPARNPGQDTGRNPGQDSGRDSGRAPGHGTGRTTGPDAGPDAPGGRPGADTPGDRSGADPGPRREYRMEELARLAGITVRTLRFYRERKLIPPPRREGRIAWYDDHHLARLRTIAALLDRGHTLSGIADLTETFDHGRDVADLLGLGAPTEEEPVRLTPEELADHFAGEVTPENFAAAMELGYVGTDGENIVHISRRLLEVSAALVREGIPLAEVLAAASQVRRHADALAALFAELVLRHGPEDGVQRLRPLARSVVEAELSLALDRRLRPAE